MAGAEAGGTHPALAHDGPWSEERYLTLPGDRRIELVDGSLLVAPTTDERHAVAVAAVRAAVEAALPDGLVVEESVRLRLSPGRILVPDLVVAARSDEPGEDVRDGAVALVVIDLVGRGNGVAERWFRPQLYAGSRIPYALLIDHDGPFAVANMLIGGRYHAYAEAEPGGTLVLEEPFALELDLAILSGDATAVPEPEPEPRREVEQDVGEPMDEAVTEAARP